MSTSSPSSPASLRRARNADTHANVLCDNHMRTALEKSTVARWARLLGREALFEDTWSEWDHLLAEQSGSGARASCSWEQLGHVFELMLVQDRAGENDKALRNFLRQQSDWLE